MNFLSTSAQGDPLDIALRYIRSEMPGKTKSPRGSRTFAADDFKGLRVRDRLVTKHNGVTHLHLQQEVNGLPIYQADINANVARDGSIIALHNRFVSIGAGNVPAPLPPLSAAECLRRAAGALHFPVLAAPRDLTQGARSDQASFSEPLVSLDAVPARLLYFPLESGVLRLAWNLIIRTPDHRHWLDMNVDAITGEVLSQADWVHEAAAYRVAALPLEGPGEGARTLLSGIEDVTASAFGWHDTNGIAGAEFTDTQGNNVQAQTDTAGTNTGGFRPSGGASLLFDFPANFNLAATNYQAASVTSLFYIVNVCHDVFYHYGFDEAAGNFQTNNYGHGGSAADAIIADAQDGAVLDNAQFSTPPDGTAPRMEMGLASPFLNVTAPASIAGSYSSLAAGFGPAFTNGLSATVVAGTDDTVNGPSPTDCCGALNNGPSVTGKVALIDRGTCNFTVKVKNAQDAGAIAVIMVNNAGDGLVSMSGIDATITIPSIFVGQSDGLKIRNAIAQGVQVRFGADTPDTAFDATIVVHEFGHGVTNRLTGGPANASALTGTIPRGLGEGWSDFFGLVFTAAQADTRTTSRLIGQYAFNPKGIRSKPYTSDIQANPLTYSHVRTLTEVHALGEIWTTALWEVYWNLVEGYGFSSNLYTGTAGNNLALQLVVDGCKLQPANPNYLQARDAILQADLVNNAGQNQFAIWQAFARRGLGLGATAGVNASDNQVTAAFDVPAVQDLAKPAGDGVPNLFKAAFHMNLFKPAHDNLPVAATTLVGQTAFPAIQFKQLTGGIGTAGIDYHVNGIRYAVEASNDLVTWVSGALVVAPVSTTTDADGVTDTVIVRSLQSHKFFRVRVTRTTAS